MPERQEVGCSEQDRYPERYGALQGMQEVEREPQQDEREQREDEAVEEPEKPACRDAAIDLIADPLRPPAREECRPEERKQRQCHDEADPDHDAPRPVVVGCRLRGCRNAHALTTPSGKGDSLTGPSSVIRKLSSTRSPPPPSI